MYTRHCWKLITVGCLLLVVLAAIGTPTAPTVAHGEGSAPVGADPANPVIPAAPQPNVAIPAMPKSSAARGKPASATNPYAPVEAATATVTNPSLDLRVLVIAATQDDVTLAAIKQSLDYVGAAYDVWVASEHLGQLTADKLAVGSHSLYNAVFLTTGNLAYSPDAGQTFQTALTPDEWNTLWAYEAAFKVRQVTWYTFPTPDYGFSSFSGLDTTTTPLDLKLTVAGRSVFKHLNANAVLTMRYSYAYPATIATGDANIKPVLQDASGRVFGATRLYPDGRENLALTFSGNQYLFHTIALSYGLLDWATRGIFLGEFRTYAQPQIDDYFLENDIWTTSTPCGTNLDLTPSGVTYRMDGGDVLSVAAWQAARRLQPTTKQLRLSYAFNGSGADPESAGGTLPGRDTLVPATRLLRSSFFWVNHTYEHLLLNDSLIPAAEFNRQLTLNHNVARRLGLSNYNKASLVTPEISGLNNPVFLNEAYTWGIRYLVSDTSRPEQRAPSPNTGIPNALRPEILMVPRHANNLFYNVSRPDEWVAEYNCLYSAFWGRSLSFQEIIDKESDMLLGYMLRGDISPWMFHQSNTRAYSGARTLLTDLLDATFAKYNRIYKLPIESLNQHAIGQALVDRAEFNQAGVQATLTGNQVTISTQGKAVVPITGVCTNVPQLNTSVEVYNGQCTLSVPLSGPSTVTLTTP